MMKTIGDALKDEIGNAFPLLGKGRAENIIIARGLNAGDEFTAEVYRSKEFIGAHADSLLALVTTPNVSESDISITLPDRNLILKRVNSLYALIGEKEVTFEQPKVYIGFS